MSRRQRCYEEDDEAYRELGRETRYEDDDLETNQLGSSSRSRYATSSHAHFSAHRRPAAYHAVSQIAKLPVVDSKEWVTFLSTRPNTGVDPEQRFNHDSYDTERIPHMLNKVYPPSHIGDGIYVSNFETAAAYIRGKSLPSYPRIKYVASIIEFKRKGSDKIWMGIQPSDKYPSHRLMQLDIPDSEKVKLGEFFPMICKWIHDRVQRRKDKKVVGDEGGEGILIHCLKGVSRSVAVVMAYRIWRYWETPQQAFATVRISRPVAWPNDEFFRQLILWHGTDCEFVKKNGEKDPRYLQYFYDYEREWKPVNQDDPRRPDPEKDMNGLKRPKDPHAREPEPQQVKPSRCGTWFGRR